MNLGMLTESWIGILMLVINLVIFWMAVRWLWVNYKASKIIIEFAEIFREALHQEAEARGRETEMVTQERDYPNE